MRGGGRWAWLGVTAVAYALIGYVYGVWRWRQIERAVRRLKERGTGAE